MKYNKLVPLSFTEALIRQNTLLEGSHSIIDTPKDDYDVYASVHKNEIIALRKHAQRWQAAFSLTAVLAIWLIAMRFI